MHINDPFNTQQTASNVWHDVSLLYCYIIIIIIIGK